jgi:DNA-binding beta-propeller fold protein YncE
MGTLRGRLGFVAILLGVAGCDTKVWKDEEAPQPDAAAPAPVAARRDGLAAPPAISGGTLAVTADGRFAVAADPDRDAVWVVDLERRQPWARVDLQPGDEPGRVVEDTVDGRVHVVLRRGGAVATIDPVEGVVVRRTPVCVAPRGIAFDAGHDALYVTCRDGALVTLDRPSGAVRRAVDLGPDLRDVVLDGGDLLVSRFRSAEVLRVSPEGGATPVHLSGYNERGDRFTPEVAWRLVPRPAGGALVVHQRAQATPLNAPPEAPAAYYVGGPCGSGLLHAAVSVIDGDRQGRAAPPLRRAVLPVDAAVSPDGGLVAVVAAGQGRTREDSSSPVLVFPTDRLTGDDCIDGGPGVEWRDSEPTAVAWTPTALVVQSREPAVLLVADVLRRTADGVVLHNPERIDLNAESRADAGHAVFHTVAATVACASCHPEGLDDGHTWLFPYGARRTQTLAGGVLATAPFHWSGDLPDMAHLADEVFRRRMGGQPLDAEHVGALGAWLDALPAPPLDPPADLAAVERGRTLFFDETVGCGKCHSGALTTDNRSYDVGTGASLQVPSLRGLRARAPFMHDGCAATLADRFGACGGGDAHGKTSQLAPGQVADLVAYLETL